MSRGKTTSKTERRTTLGDAWIKGVILGKKDPHSFKTSISGGGKRAEGRGDTAREAEKNASRRYKR